MNSGAFTESKHPDAIEEPKTVAPVTIEIPPFMEFPKIARLTREMVITEKLDGTNAQIFIADDFQTMYVGSRSRWLASGEDNFGFYAWCMERKTELLKLGPGRHFGEFWGQGIQRRYGLNEKRFSLFNTSRWNAENIPSCCHVVPELYRGEFSTEAVGTQIERLRVLGSVASPGFMKPEGVVVFHTHGSYLFKKTLEKDELPKSLVK